MELTVVKPDEILLYSDYEFEYNTQTYTMKSLYKVSVLTTDEGPFVDDVALALFFTDIIIAIPSEHPDYQNTYDQLSKTLKFNYEEYIKAMSCSDNAEFVLWEKYDNSEDMIFCPLVDKDVDGFDCMEYQCVKDECIPEEFKQKPDWKTICESCKYYGYV